MEPATLDELEAWARGKPPLSEVGQACRSATCPVAQFYKEVRGLQVLCVLSRSASVRERQGAPARHLTHPADVARLIRLVDKETPWLPMGVETFLALIARARVRPAVQLELEG